MQFFALDDNESILAQEALRHKNYLCPECFHPLRLREGPHRRAHFYHLKENLLCRQHKKSLTHLTLQLHFFDSLPKGEIFLEHSFPEIGRIADVFWKPKNIVFEVQCSPMSLNEAMARCKDYAKLGIKLVWILHQKRFNKRKMSSAEEFLRSHTNCYFTSMDEKGVGIIYDQFEVRQNKRRLFFGKPLKIDFLQPNLFLSLPERIETPQLIKERINKWPLFFPGDLTSYHLNQEDFTSLLNIEKRFNPSAKYPLWQLIKKSYKTLFHILLEKASQ